MRHSNDSYSISLLHPRLKNCLCRYMSRLRGVIGFSEEWLVLLMSLQTMPLRRELADFILSQADKKARCNELCTVLSSSSKIVRFAEYVFMDIQRKEVKTTYEKLDKQMNRFFKQVCAIHAKTGQPCPKDAISQLQDMFELSAEETDVMCLLCCVEQVKILRSLFQKSNPSEFVDLTSVATRIPVRKVKQILQKSGKLYSVGIINHNDPDDAPLFQIHAEVLAFISGLDDVPLRDLYLHDDSGKTFALKSFNIPESSRHIIKSLLASPGPCNILLYGKAGTGKTEFARSVIHHAGKHAFFMQNGLLPPDSSSARRWYDKRAHMQGAVSLVPKKTGVLIVDEADTLLNTKYFVYNKINSPDKSWLNAFLDQSTIKIIWITNDSEFMDESAMRRFSYSLCFKSFTCHERKTVWKNLVRRHPLRSFLTPPLVEELATRYRVNAAGISSALGILKKIVPPDSSDQSQVKTTLHELLKRHEEAIGSHKTGEISLLNEKYELSALNLDTDPDKILETLTRFTGRKRDGVTNSISNINLLFWGPPGTGKTELAKYVANRLSLGLCIKRASDLLSMWVGGTERNIKDAFEEAECDHNVLLIDEADSFFINRASAQRSWETSQTNELLTQMENYKGILICCTNLPDHLDRAVLRRFAWKVEFKPLTDEGREKIFSSYFLSPGQSLSAEERFRLKQIKGITPGDFKAVWHKFGLLDSETCSRSDVFDALEKEVEYKNIGTAPIGFN